MRAASTPDAPNVQRAFRPSIVEGHDVVVPSSGVGGRRTRATELSVAWPACVKVRYLPCAGRLNAHGLLTAAR